MSNSFVLLDSAVTDGFTHFRVPSTWHHSQDRHARQVVKLCHAEQRFLSKALASDEDAAPKRSKELYSLHSDFAQAGKEERLGVSATFEQVQ